jgi:chromosome segregation ATPase
MKTDEKFTELQTEIMRAPGDAGHQYAIYEDFAKKADRLIPKLEKEIAELKAERDELKNEKKRWVELVCDQAEEIDKLRTEVERLRLKNDLSNELFTRVDEQNHGYVDTLAALTSNRDELQVKVKRLQIENQKLRNNLSNELIEYDRLSAKYNASDAKLEAVRAGGCPNDCTAIEIGHPACQRCFPCKKCAGTGLSHPQNADESPPCNHCNGTGAVRAAATHGGGDE